MLLLLLLSLSMDSRVVFNNLDQEYTPSRQNAAVSAEGYLFLLDIFDGSARYLDPEGKPMGSLGSKGKGPEEYQHLTKMFLMNNTLFLIDQMGSKVLIYDGEGRFQKSVSAPRQKDILPTSKGWSIGNWMFSTGGREPIQLRLADNAFENEKVVLSWHPEHTGTLGFSVSHKPGERPKFPYNPVPDTAIQAVSADGNTLYVYQPGSSIRIHVVDVGSGKRLKTIRRDGQKVPFDEAWGKKQMEQVQMRNNQRGGRMEMVPNFPEFYPNLSSMMVALEGPLIIGRRTGERYHMQAIDQEGHDVTLPYNANHEAQILAIQDKMAFVGVSTGVDEAAVVKVPLDQVSAVVDEFKKDK